MLRTMPAPRPLQTVLGGTRRPEQDPPKEDEPTDACDGSNNEVEQVEVAVLGESVKHDPPDHEASG
jgi:hypothetical protein